MKIYNYAPKIRTPPPPPHSPTCPLSLLEGGGKMADSASCNCASAAKGACVSSRYLPNQMPSCPSCGLGEAWGTSEVNKKRKENEEILITHLLQLVYLHIIFPIFRRWRWR